MEFQKYNVKEKKKKKKKKTRSENYKKYIYMKFAEEKKIGSFFFCKVIGYKSEN